MKKRIFALLLAAMLPLGAAIADEPLTDGTVLVDWVDGQEAYTAICSGELTLRYDADTNTYATADGLIWKTEGALPFATYQPAGDAHGHSCDTQRGRVPDGRPRYKLVSHGGRGHADRRASAGAV